MKTRRVFLLRLLSNTGETKPKGRNSNASMASYSKASVPLSSETIRWGSTSRPIPTNMSRRSERFFHAFGPARVNKTCSMSSTRNSTSGLTQPPWDRKNTTKTSRQRSGQSGIGKRSQPQNMGTGTLKNDKN